MKGYFHPSFSMSYLLPVITGSLIQSLSISTMCHQQLHYSAIAVTQPKSNMSRNATCVMFSMEILSITQVLNSTSFLTSQLKAPFSSISNHHLPFVLPIKWSETNRCSSYTQSNYLFTFGSHISS